MTTATQWAMPAWLKALVSGALAIIKSYLTASDNQSWAPGRLMGFAVFIVGQCLVIRVAQWGLVHATSIADLLQVFGGVSTFEVAICGTSVGLVLGMAPADPGGKWWGKDNSPPPPPADLRR